MGRPPCCDKVGIKKGPWTPEEDIILVSYIQEHGPGNWRSVPTNTGLMRCSKSCRLRWTNYLRPGIKRGNFTPHEEGMIIHLQALLGNKWAAIASYLPQRTDNDIKNYWNTHLKKKLKKFQSALEPQMASSDSTTNVQLLPKSPFSDHDQRSLDFTNNQLGSSTRANQSTVSSSTYASSTENISRLLEGWMRSSSSNLKSSNLKGGGVSHEHEEDHKSHEIGNFSSLRFCEPKNELGDLVSHEEFDSILSFENMNNNNNNNNVTSWERSSGDSSTQNYKRCSQNSVDHEINYDLNDDHNKNNDHHVLEIEKNNINNVITPPPMSYIEKWLLDESTCGGHVEELMELSPMF